MSVFHKMFKNQVQNVFHAKIENQSFRLMVSLSPCFLKILINFFIKKTNTSEDSVILFVKTKRVFGKPRVSLSVCVMSDTRMISWRVSGNMGRMNRPYWPYWSRRGRVMFRRSRNWLGINWVYGNDGSISRMSIKSRCRIIKSRHIKICWINMYYISLHNIE